MHRRKHDGLPPNDPAPARHEHSHNVTLLIRYWLSSHRRDSRAARDMRNGFADFAASEQRLQLAVCTFRVEARFEGGAEVGTHRQLAMSAGEAVFNQRLRALRSSDGSLEV